MDVSHSNGLGQTYEDPAPLGQPGSPQTYTLAMALKARAAWPTTGTDSTAPLPRGGAAVTRRGEKTGAAWAYSGPTAGRVRLNRMANTPVAPTATDPTWT